MPVDFYVLDIDQIFKAILEKPWIDNLNGVPSTAHQCLKFPFQGRIVKVECISMTRTVEAISKKILPTLWPTNKLVISVMDLDFP